MFFRANVSQVKLDNISFLFNMMLHLSLDDQILSALFTNSKKNESKYMKHRKHPLRDFLQNRFNDTLTLADFSGKNWYRHATSR